MGAHGQHNSSMAQRVEPPPPPASGITLMRCCWQRENTSPAALWQQKKPTALWQHQAYCTLAARTLHCGVKKVCHTVPSTKPAALRHAPLWLQ